MKSPIDILGWRTTGIPVALALLLALAPCGQLDRIVSSGVTAKTDTSQANPEASAQPPAQAAPTSGSASIATPLPVAAYFSWITAGSLKEVIAKSDVIVIGEMTGMGAVFNSDRDTQDHSKPAANSFGVRQEYIFHVQRYLKGNSPEVITVSQAEGAISGPPEQVTPADIARAKAASGVEPLVTGVQYLLFLVRATDDTGKEYYGGAIEPWRFALSADGVGRMEPSGEAYLKIPRDFIPDPDAPLIPQVEQLIREEQATSTP